MRKLFGVLVFRRSVNVLVRPAYLTSCFCEVSGSCFDPAIKIKHGIIKTEIIYFWMEDSFIA
jgi:hypothetical protein